MADNFKIEDVIPETLDTRTSYTKEEEPIENVSMPTIVVPDNSYGNNQDTLDANVSIRNLSVSTPTQYFCGLVQRTSGATGSQAITGVGFTPKYISYTLLYRDGSPLMSTGFANSITNTSYVQMDMVAGNGHGATGTGASPVLAHIRTAGGAYIEPHLTSFDSDGFTINWTYISQNADLIYTCYG